MIRKYTYQKETKLATDNKFSDLKSRLALTSSGNVKLISEVVPCFDQLQLGSCVANATIGATSILLGVEGKTFSPLSRLFPYWNARNYDGNTNKDDGTFVRNAFQSLKDIGVCLESTWAYDETKVFVQPSVEAYREADDNKISNFYRIDSVGTQKCDDVLTALNANHPVVFGTQISKDIESYDGSNDNAWDIPTSNIAGGHSMCIVGYRTSPNLQFYIRNSWSTSFGINGHFWITSNYLMWPQTDDLWVPTLIPDIRAE